MALIGSGIAGGKDGACIPRTGTVRLRMESAEEFWTAKALLDWQIEMGVDECIGDTPVDRYALPQETAKPAKPSAAPAIPAVIQQTPASQPPKTDPQQEAQKAAAAAQDLSALRLAVTSFDHCPLKASARHTLFDAGTQGAKVMVLTDPPSPDDDRAGQLLTGAEGAFFDKMFAAIGLSRDGTAPIYIAPALPWSPPRSAGQLEGDLAIMRPFLLRQIELASPELLVLMSNSACHSLLGRSGLTRLRGRWQEAADRPALPIYPPSLLIGTPEAKRDVWADLLTLKSRLDPQ